MITIFKEYVQYDDIDDDIDDDIYDLANSVEKYVMGDDNAIDVSRYYYNTLKDLDNNGGDVYRLIFLSNKEDLKKEYLGESWTIDYRHLEDFADRLHRNYVIEAPTDEIKQQRMDMTPYLITAHIDKNNVDFEKSIEVFTWVYYYEYEVILKNNPSNISIEEYDRTWSDDDISEKSNYLI